MLRLNPEPGCGNADSAWNCGLLLLMSSSGRAQRLLSLEYFRLARALYEDPESQATCTAKIATVISGLGSPDEKDVPTPRRGQRNGPALTDPAVAAQVEDGWQTLDRLHRLCSVGVKQRSKYAPRIVKLATKLIQLDPLGR